LQFRGCLTPCCPTPCCCLTPRCLTPCWQTLAEYEAKTAAAMQQARERHIKHAEQEFMQVGEARGRRACGAGAGMALPAPACLQAAAAPQAGCRLPAAGETGR
jgi:hypothetical protein